MPEQHGGELTPEEIHLMWRAGLITNPDAVAAIRRATGWGLRQAVDYLDGRERPEPPQGAPGDP